MAIETLTLSPRTVTGKKVKKLRGDGMVPVHMYGGAEGPMTLQVAGQLLRRVLPRVGSNIPLTVAVEGVKGESTCFVREVQRHPVSEELLHVDFLRVDVSQQIRAEVPIRLTGVAPAARELGGTLLQPLQSILVEALPMSIPAALQVDVSNLDDFEKTIFVRDVEVGSDVTVITSDDELLARVMPPRILEEFEIAEAAEEGEEVEGEGEGEGEAGADASDQDAEEEASG